jgi:hypothetical protein
MEGPMLRLARVLQVVGILALPPAIAVGMTRRDTGTALAVLAAGGALFLVGRLMERRIP